MRNVNEQEPVNWKWELLEWAKVLVIGIAAGLFINQLIIVNSYVPSGSMENTLMTGDRVLGNRLSYIFSDPQRYDVVVFDFPDDESVQYVKRIIGLPGETVEITGGRVYIDGSAIPLEEPYTPEPPIEADFGPYQVPAGHYFMLGDNRNHSADSRYWQNTFVEKKKITGKLSFIYFPRFEILEKFEDAPPE